MELRRYFSVLARRWWMILLGPLIAGVCAFVVSGLLTPVYSASSTLLVNQVQSEGPIQYNDILTSERLTNTYAELIRQRPVLQTVIDRLDLEMSIDDLQDRVSVSTVQDTQLLRASVRDEDPALAADIANTLASAFITQNAEELGRPGTVSIAEEARIPDDPVEPRTTLNTVIAVVLGLLLAAGLVAVLEYLDDTVKRPEDVEERAGATTLALVPRFRQPRNRGRAPVTEEWPHSALAETFRVMRTNLQFASMDLQVKSLLVTSAHPGEGKTTTCANLAVAIAQTGRRVIVVDSDLRRPSLHLLFSQPNRQGLTNQLLLGEGGITRFLRATEVEGITFLPAGLLPPNPAELLGSPRMGRLLDELTATGAMVLLDSPPLLSVADAAILAAQTDGVILVVDAGKTRHEAVRRARATLDRAGARILGAVLNRVTGRREGYYYDGYYSAPAQDAAAGRSGAQPAGAAARSQAVRRPMVDK
ncbi:MAG: polysaccharide biosynthesis tyrosine autokinase [Dehalococcoidia bacterium]|nr:polysaccharide biosynthesis tyrosine autokinase [Dehalococcoidia bacterium]